MKKQFVTFPIAVALKELGFNEKCLTSFDRDGSLFSIFDQSTDYSFVTYIDDTPDRHYCILDEIPDEYTLAPLWQQVTDWLRFIHNIDITIRTGIKNLNKVYHYSFPFIDENFNWNTYDSYEEAREAAILKAIEIIKNQ